LSENRQDGQYGKEFFRYGKIVLTPLAGIEYSPVTQGPVLTALGAQEPGSDARTRHRPGRMAFVASAIVMRRRLLLKSYQK